MESSGGVVEMFDIEGVAGDYLFNLVEIGCVLVESFTEESKRRRIRRTGSARHAELETVFLLICFQRFLGMGKSRFWFPCVVSRFPSFPCG